jgi:signal transduction histidine kinase
VDIGVRIVPLARFTSPPCVYGKEINQLPAHPYVCGADQAADGYFRMMQKPVCTLLHLAPGLGNGISTRRKENWELLESSSLKIAKENLHQLNMELESRVAGRTAELNNALRARDEFLAMLGHELRNPLAPIRTATEIIRTLTPPDSPISPAAAILNRQVGHMTRLVDDLLDVGRITQGLIHLDRSVISLSEVIEQAVELSGQRALYRLSPL